MMISTKASPASQLILEDALKKCLSKTGTVNAPTMGKKFAPRSMHSPFGDFPKDLMPKKERTSGADSIGLGDPSPMSIAGASILKKGTGLGGKTTSKNKKEEEIKVSKKRSKLVQSSPPKAGAK